MNLSNDLVSQFVKATKDTKKRSTESTVYGTTVEYNGKIYVKLDGSDLLTPVSKTTNAKHDERVTVMIKDHAATITGNITSPSASSGDVQEVGEQVLKVENLIAGKVSTQELEAQIARIDTLVAETAVIDSLVAENAVIKNKLTASEAEINKIVANNVTINEKLTAQEGIIVELDAVKLDAADAKLTYASIESLEAIEGEFHTFETTYGDIKELIFGSASGDTIHTSFSNAVIAQLGEAQIKSAMIENISADKIQAGDIITNNVRVMSEDGSLVISDETIQISDADRVRVQIGKDTAGDYSINIWDSEGNLMFSEGGITDNAIKDAIIRNDMVAADANIAASKLDISSLFKEINDSTETIKASRVYIDQEQQALDVAFTQMSSTVDGLNSTLTSQGTQLSAIQGQITSKVWQQDIDTIADELGNEIETLNTKHTTLEQTLNGISVTVNEHETEIASKADNATVNSIRNQVTELDVDLQGFKTTVRDTYASNSALDSLVDRVSTAETSIEQNKEEIALRATKTEVGNIAVQVDETKEDMTQLAVRMSSAESEISQNAEEISLRVTKAEHLENVNTLNARVDSAQTAIEQNADKIELRATKEELTSVRNAANSLDVRITSAESAINQNADAILSRVTKQELLGVEIGARNYILNSTNLIFDKYFFADATITVTDDGNGNVTVTSAELAVSDDGNGNVTLSPSYLIEHMYDNGTLILS